MIQSFLAVLCEITNYIFFIYSRKLTSHLNTIDEFDEKKGKQIHEHSQEKHKHTQDFRYLNLPQQLYVLLQLQLYLIKRIIYRALFFLFSKINFYIREPATHPLKTEGLYIQNLEVSPPQR